MGLDFGLGHAGEVVPGLVVFAHMVQAEPNMLVELAARAGRAKIAFRRAFGKGAAAQPGIGGQRDLLNG